MRKKVSEEDVICEECIAWSKQVQRMTGEVAVKLTDMIRMYHHISERLPYETPGTRRMSVAVRAVMSAGSSCLRAAAIARDVRNSLERDAILRTKLNGLRKGNRSVNAKHSETCTTL